MRGISCPACKGFYVLFFVVCFSVVMVFGGSFGLVLGVVFGVLLLLFLTLKALTMSNEQSLKPNSLALAEI